MWQWMEGTKTRTNRTWQVGLWLAPLPPPWATSAVLLPVLLTAPGEAASSDVAGPANGPAVIYPGRQVAKLME